MIKGYNIMLDLETMSIEPNAAIVAIGAVVFNQRCIVKEFYQKISLESSMQLGLHIRAETVLWWLAQGEQARKEIYEPSNKQPLKEALMLLSSWWGVSNGLGLDVPVWGNGAAFDNVVLRSAYTACGWGAPWAFRSDRCFRTARAMFPELNLEFEGAKHNALEDARYQAKYLMRLAETHGGLT